MHPLGSRHGIEEGNFLFSNKELRAVGVRPAVGHGKPSWLVKEQVGMQFILKLKANIATRQYLMDRRPES